MAGRAVKVVIKKEEGIMDNKISTGISMGCALAMVLSYSINKSIGYAIIHGLFTWVYVIYFAMAY